jgi:hypothetical protein
MRHQHRARETVCFLYQKVVVEGLAGGRYDIGGVDRQNRQRQQTCNKEKLPHSSLDVYHTGDVARSPLARRLR